MKKWFYLLNSLVRLYEQFVVPDPQQWPFYRPLVPQLKPDYFLFSGLEFESHLESLHHVR